MLVVGTAGFEPATPCSQSRCADQAAPRPVATARELSEPRLPDLARSFERHLRAEAGRPLKPRTIQTALGELEAAGLARGSEEGNPPSPLLVTRHLRTTPVGKRGRPDARAAARRAGVGRRRLLPPCDTEPCLSAPSSNAGPRGSGRWPSASTGQGGVGAPGAPSSPWRRLSPNPTAAACGRHLSLTYWVLGLGCRVDAPVFSKESSWRGPAPTVTAVQSPENVATATPGSAAWSGRPRPAARRPARPGRPGPGGGRRRPPRSGRRHSGGG